MSATTLATIMGICAVPVLALMWFAWRARTRRDAGALTVAEAPTGAVVARFEHAGYVSTTPEGSPLERVAIPGLRYRGNADVTVREDGLTIQVAGEAPVHIGRERLRGGGTARTRVGKAVERDGLALVRWETGGRSLESSFRMRTPVEQRGLIEAIDSISGGRDGAAPQTLHHNQTTQEDA